MDITARIMTVVAVALGSSIAAKSFVRLLVSVDLALTRNIMRFARMAQTSFAVLYTAKYIEFLPRLNPNNNVKTIKLLERIIGSRGLMISCIRNPITMASATKSTAKAVDSITAQRWCQWDLAEVAGSRTYSHPSERSTMHSR